ncbi:MAG: SDR family NAD(P)-dependent oxidoreductase, partial [Syntrophaceae bacterium]
MTAGDQVPSYIVTGANSGIGKATAFGLAQKGLRVVMVCRDEGRGRLAREEIIARNGGGNVELVIGDLSSCAGVRAAAACILDAAPRIGALINNAGIWLLERTLNADGIEMTFFVNHLA